MEFKEFRAKTVEDAEIDAARAFGVVTADLEVQVIEKGSAGFHARARLFRREDLLSGEQFQVLLRQRCVPSILHRVLHQPYEPLLRALS